MITQKHLEEFAKSGIPKEIAETIFRSVSDNKQIADFLRWQNYKGPAGWLYEGIDPLTGKPTGIGQFKPDGGIVFPNGDEAKYLTQKDDNGKGKFDACCVAVPGIDWQKVAADITQLIRLVEGVKKSVASMIHTNIPTIGLSGVDMATYGRSGNLTPSAEKLCVAGRTVEIAYDSDIIDKKEVRGAAIALGRSLKKVGCRVLIRTWPQSLGKGLDDAIENVGAEEFDKRSTVQDFDEWCSTVSPKKKRPPEQSVIAQKIADLWKEKLAWRPNYQKWYRYGAEIEGIWSREPEELIGKLIALELDSEGINFSAGYLSGVLKLVKIHLAHKSWDEVPGFIPTTNGVVNIDTLELLPHDSNRRLTWCLPYDYNKAARCEPILEWLKDAVSGNESMVQLLRAYLAAIIRGRSDLHGFVEVQGPGGSGKGTFLQLAKALVGARNTHTTRLKKLENSPFETAALFGKKLILIDDSDKYVGSVEVLKSLTGGGEIPYEEKYIQQGQDSNFICKAKVLIACNEGIQSSDYTSGLQRRRINVPFLNQIAKKDQRTLLDEENGELKGEFAKFMPGFLNWVLELDNQSIENYLRRTEEFVVGQRQLQLEAILQTNPIADWADCSLVYEVGAKLQIGVAQPNREGGQSSYLNVNIWAYASYREYCINAGMARDKIMSLRRFIPLVKDLFINQLKLHIKHSRDRVCSFFENLRLRSSEVDDVEPLISGLSAPVIDEAPTPELAAPVIDEAPTPELAAPAWESFPSARTDSKETRKNKALACYNQQIKAIQTSKNVQSLASKLIRWTKAELNWVATYLMSPEQVRQLEAIIATNQMELDL